MTHTHTVSVMINHVHFILEEVKYLPEENVDMLSLKSFSYTNSSLATWYDTSLSQVGMLYL